MSNHQVSFGGYGLRDFMWLATSSLVARLRNIDSCTCGSRNCWKSETFFSLETRFCCKVVIEFVTYCIWFVFYSAWCLNTINVVFIFAFVYCFVYLLPYFCFHVIFSIKKVRSIMFFLVFLIRWFRLSL